MYKVEVVKVFDKVPTLTPAVERALEQAVDDTLERIQTAASHDAPRSALPPHHPTSGHMADRFTTERQGLMGEVGNEADYFVYVEEGTYDQPPRASLGPAAAKEESALEATAAEHMRRALP